MPQKCIDERIEILHATIFKYSVDNEYLIWDELRRGTYFENVVLVHKAQIVFLKIMQLMAEKELKIPALLCLCYKLGLFMQAFYAIALVQPAAAKLASLDKLELGGRNSAKLRPRDIIQITTWFRDLDKPDKKRKKLYEEVKNKWNTTNPDRTVCLRTIEKYLKANF